MPEVPVVPVVPVVSVPDFVPDSVPASVCVVCVFVVSAASFPLHAVSNNAALSVKTGIQIGINSFGKGLALFHYGSIIVNGTAQFGEFCVVQSDVNVSAGVRGGNEVYIAPGVKILENIAIADNVIIGANAVVCKDIEEPHTSWGGIPAKKISEKGFEFKM